MAYVHHLQLLCLIAARVHSTAAADLFDAQMPNKRPPDLG